MGRRGSTTWICPNWPAPALYLMAGVQGHSGMVRLPRIEHCNTAIRPARGEMTAKGRLMGSISHQYGLDMAQ
ncbi:hypothetical protein G6F65_021622 [Rhizopus arrhizus]|nr:hypothetical protein G6F65_021622 [Rhizopus arrhizus]